MAYYRERFAQIDSLTELLAVGRELNLRERELGNIAAMAQLMAGAQHDLMLAEAARYAMAAWNKEIEGVVRRVLAGSPLVDLVDAPGLAQAISAGFIGLELYEGVDPVGGEAALDALDTLGHLLEAVNDLGPVATRVFRSTLAEVLAQIMTAGSPSVTSRLVVAGLFAMFLFVLAIGIQLVGLLAVLAPSLFASSLAVGALGVAGGSLLLRWCGQRPASVDRHVAVAFGVAGGVCIATAFLFLGFAESPPGLFAFSVAFVAIATATLALWPGRPLQTFGGLWGLAIVLMTIYLERGRRSDGRGLLVHPVLQHVPWHPDLRSLGCLRPDRPEPQRFISSLRPLSPGERTIVSSWQAGRLTLN